MKKASANILLILTVVFTAFLCGFFCGRNLSVRDTTVTYFNISAAAFSDAQTDAAASPSAVLPEAAAAQALSEAPVSLAESNETLAPQQQETGAPQVQESLTEQSDAVSLSSALVNVNTASLELLKTLPGIGDVLGQRIIDYREANGPFENLSELMNVSGIGEKKLAALQDYATVGG